MMSFDFVKFCLMQPTLSLHVSNNIIAEEFHKMAHVRPVVALFYLYLICTLKGSSPILTWGLTYMSLKIPNLILDRF